MLLVGTGQKHPCICFRVLYRSEGQQRSRSRYRYSCTRGIRRQASSLSCRACKLSSGRQEDRTIGTESMTWQWDVRRNAHVSMKADGGFFAKVSAEKLYRCQEVCPHFSRLQLAAADLFLLLPNCDRPHPARHLIQRPSFKLFL